MPHDSQKLEFQSLFGNQIKRIRLAQNLSLRKLSQRCNLDHSDIAKYARGEVNIQLSTEYELSVGLNVHPKELFDFKLVRLDY